jgi:hypothetical protein
MSICKSLQISLISSCGTPSFKYLLIYLLIFSSIFLYLKNDDLLNAVFLQLIAHSLIGSNKQFEKVCSLKDCFIYFKFSFIVFLTGYIIISPSNSTLIMSLSIIIFSSGIVDINSLL